MVNLKKQSDYSIFDRIAAFIIKDVQDLSDSDMSGFQYVVAHAIIQEHFANQIEEYIQEKVINALYEREEVADVVIDTDGYDVVLYTDYAPNYCPDNWI